MFAYVTDIHGNFENLRQFVKLSRADFPELKYLLVGGDLTRRPRFTDDWTKVKMGDIAEAIEIFSASGLKTFFILGNDDLEHPFPKPLETEDLLLMTSEVVEVERGIGLLGFSYVPPTPFGTRYERDEETLRGMLEPLFEQLQAFKFRIVMCHAPPHGTNLDLSKDWYLKDGRIDREIFTHVGCKAVRKLIKRYQPDLGLFGHVHESPGTCRIGRTVCVNPGASNQQISGCVFDLDRLVGIGEFDTVKIPRLAERRDERWKAAFDGFLKACGDQLGPRLPR